MTDYRQSYQSKLGRRVFTSLSTVEAGDIIQFQYKGDLRLVFVLASSWKGKLHGISLKEVPPDNFLDLKEFKGKNADPEDIYNSIRGLSQRYGAYRQYLLPEIRNVQQIREKVAVKTKTTIPRAETTTEGEIPIDSQDSTGELPLYE